MVYEGQLSSHSIRIFGSCSLYISVCAVNHIIDLLLMKLTSIISFGYVLTRGQAEREFKVEGEAIGRVRHKHLVRLLGYCMEGEYRLLACMQMCCILRILCQLIL